MVIQLIDGAFTVCQVETLRALDPSCRFFFLSQTDEECSLVCPTAQVPAHTLRREDGWRVFRIGGTLDFSLVGVLSSISSLLAERGISIFAVSTYNTDYLLTREEDFPAALRALEEKGYTIEGQ